MSTHKQFPCSLDIIKTFIVFFSMVTKVNSIPPEDPIKCHGTTKNTNCTITNSIGAFPDRSICRAAKGVFPTTEAELISAVANATIANQKMKVATCYSHSIPQLACPDGEQGVIISTRYLNRVLVVNASAMTITVESGMTLKQLIGEAAKENMALPCAPYWWGVTVGGMLGTGAHGSSLWGLGSQVHDYVTRVRIISPGQPGEGYARVRTLEIGNTELDAAKVSLGVLGVLDELILFNQGNKILIVSKKRDTIVRDLVKISKVTLKLQPLFKRSITYIEKNDSDFGDQAVKFGREHEFSDFTWYPSQNLVLYQVDDRVSSNTSGNGLLDASAFRSATLLVLWTLRSTEIQETLGDAEGKCLSGRLITSTLRTQAFGLKNNGIFFTGYPVVGYNNHIQASGSCLDSREDLLFTTCAWDPRVKGLFYHQTTFSIALSEVENFIQDVQQLVVLEPKSLCVLDTYNGILMRYVTASSAYLGKQEDALDFDITYYRSKDPLAPRLFEDIPEEIEQIAIFKYSALPHWGKNRNVAFQGVIDKYKNAGKFLKVKVEYDPRGLFSSDWTDKILGLKEGLSIVKEGCALEGLCICSEHVPCAPEKGYFCRTGRVYKEARVCSKSHVTITRNSIASSISTT